MTRLEDAGLVERAAVLKERTESATDESTRPRARLPTSARAAIQRNQTSSIASHSIRRPVLCQIIQPSKPEFDLRCREVACPFVRTRIRWIGITQSVAQLVSAGSMAGERRLHPRLLSVARLQPIARDLILWRRTRLRACSVKRWRGWHSEHSLERDLPSRWTQRLRFGASTSLLCLPTWPARKVQIR